MRRAGVIAASILVLGVLLSSSALAIAVTPISHAGSPAGLRTPGSARTAAPFVSHPSGSPNVAIPFYSNNISVGNVSPSDVVLGPYGDYDQSQNPTVMLLANGQVGVGFSALSTNTTSKCPGAAGASFTRIAWANSTDGGHTFSHLKYVGNTGSDGCPYFEGLEPSFAVSSNGEIFGAYVETNASLTTLDSYPGYGTRIVADYANRSQDALAFVNSSDNGGTFSPTSTLVTGGNISDPQVAAFGKTVYVVYENISNGTGYSAPHLPGAGYYTSEPTPGGVSLHLVYSSNGGATWHGPYNIPAAMPLESASELDTAYGVSIAVNATGTLAVAFAANRSCDEFCGVGGFPTYGDDIVVRTSTSNGTAWGPARVAATGAVEFPLNYEFVGPGIWQEIVQTVVKFSPDGRSIYVAWAQAENLSLTDNYASQYDWESSGIRAAASSNLGLTWTSSDASPVPPSLDFNQQVFGQGYFNPGLGVAPDGTVYVTFGYYNWTNGGYGYNAWQQNVYGIGDPQFVTTSPDGIHWGSPVLVDYLGQQYAVNFADYWGYTSSICFNATGSPILAYAQMNGFYAYLPWIPGSGQPVVLAVATLDTAATTTLTIHSTGLASGARWEAAVNSYIINTTFPIVNVTDVPVDLPIYVFWPGHGASAGYRTIEAPTLSNGPVIDLATPGTVWFNFSAFYGINFTFLPLNQPYVYLSINNYGQNGYRFSWNLQNYYYTSLNYYQYGTPNFPWYFAAGTNLSLSGGLTYFGTSTFVGYWNGTGAGSYTGTDPTPTLQVDSAFNETGWMVSDGTYDLGFSAPHLPSSSTFTVKIDGQTLTGPGGGNATATNITSGPYALSGIAATSATAGWEYFGTSDEGNPIVVPDVPHVNLSFAYVDVAAASGTVHFQEEGLPSGTSWHLSFNGTEYSSTTSEINVTTRPGTYPVASYPAVSPTGNASFAPTGIGSGGSVVPGKTYPVNFSAAYQVDVLGSTGGRITPSGGQYWYLPGKSVNLTAVPSTGYRFLGWTGTGTGAYSGSIANVTATANGPLTESASFGPLVPNRFNVTVTQTGLPAGTPWTANLGGTEYGSTGSSIAIPNLYSCTYSGSAGSYIVSIPYVYPNATPGVRYAPSPMAQTACGGGAPLAISFTAQYEVSLSSTTGGSASSLSFGTSAAFWIANGSTVTLTESNDPGYDFVGWVGTGPGSYTGATASPPVTPLGPVSEIATFQVHVTPPTPTYNLTIRSTPSIPNGTLWTVTLDGLPYSSTTSSFVVPGLADGTYYLNATTVTGADGLSEWVWASSTEKITVSGNSQSTVPFTAEYRVSISKIGPGSVGPASGWFVSGHPIALTATPSAGAKFLGWSGSGAGAYSGTTANQTLTATGPITEVATFALAPPAASTGSTSSGLLGSPAVWAGLGVVGLVIGVVVGYGLSRGRSRPPEGSDPSDGGSP